MKKDKSSEKIKNFTKKRWSNFTDWFTDKEHPHSRLNKNVFFYDSLKLIGLILVFLIIYSNVDKINQIVLIFIKIGSLLQLILLFFILRKAWHLIINLKYFFRGLNHGTKAIIAIVIVLLLFWAFLNQSSVINSITQTYNETNFSKLNPLQVGFGTSASQNIEKVTIKDVRDSPEKYLDKKIKIDGLTWQCDAVLPEWKDLGCIKEKINSSSFFLPVNQKFTTFNQNISIEGFLKKESRGIYLKVSQKDSSLNQEVNELSSCKSEIEEESRKLKERALFPVTSDIREYRYFNETSEAIQYLKEWQILDDWSSSTWLEIYYKDFTRDYSGGFWLFLVRINVKVDGQEVGVLKPIMCVDGKLTQESKSRFN